MSLVPDYGDSSGSSNDDSSDIEDKSEAEVQTKANISALPKLPAPDFTVKSIPDENGLQTNSVFKNPFLEAENEKEAVLQKHVKMIDLKNAIVINGKKICWNYRKGRCRFGHNCKFAHDSDIQKTPEQIESEKNIIQTNGIVVHKKHNHTVISNECEDDDNKSISNAKRKRPGLTQGLIPGKRVMKHYMNQK
ncbi:hypothetical protein HHI36_007707 [Cryptolaemus montrouzieri]|uniref:C3H1-type domain-containing protein n=1 Tax=Cryptolaemus montrouzieri TaxID=559131 RepID=A0ABD2MQC3_9CUCU